MLGHSLAILMTTYAYYIPGTQDEAARLMDEILTPIPIDFSDLEKLEIGILQGKSLPQGFTTQAP